MRSIYGKSKRAFMPQYQPNSTQLEHMYYCIRNDIRISIVGLKDDKDHWKISIIIGPYQKWEKANVSPSIYDKKEIWVEFYRMCEYYYNKNKIK